ncbi:MAG: MFS transporter [Chloroflexi bacterium]|nr:MFS transporter [Chloroflexota bacterium]
MSASSSRRAVNAWVMYDWANSAFATTIMAAVLPTFYSAVAAKGSLTPVQASSTWGLTQTLGMLLVALTAPVLGAIADYSGSKKRFLAAFAIPGILATSLMVLLTTGSWVLASLLYIVGEIGFSGSLIFYDSLLPHVAKEDEINAVSARGYAMGYLGGGILLAINILWIQMPDLFGITALGARFGVSGAEMASRLSFLSVGVWWAVFSIPLFRTVKEPPRSRLASERTANSIAGGFGRLLHTFKELRLYRQLLIFIVAFWIYNDGIGTIIKMATIYGAEIGIGQIDLIGALLLTQFIGIPFSLLFGRMPQRNDPRQAFFVSMVIFSAISLPLVGILAPRLGIKSGPMAVGVALGLLALGLAFSWLVGRRIFAPLANRMNAKNAILLALVVYAAVSVWGYFMATAVEFWLLAMMVGLVQGGSQALSRSLFGNMVPKAQTAEFFGFYDMSSKFAGLLGPLVFAVVGQLAGSSRLSIVSLIVFFIVGGAVLSRVNEEEGVRVARAADARASVMRET